MARPANYPSWATNPTYPPGSSDWSGQTTKVAPSAGKQASGLVPNSDQPAEEMNWILNFFYIWFQWLLTLPTIASDAPQYQYQDASGNTRTVFDHNGYPSGRRSEYRENWDFNQSTNTIISNNTIFAAGAYSRWFAKTTHATRTTMTTQPGGGAFSSYMELNLNSAISTDADVIYGAYPWTVMNANLSLVMECDLRVNSASNATIGVGLVDINNAGSSAGPGNESRVGLYKRNADTNWKAYTANGSAPTITDLGVAVATGSWLSIRIEMHGASSPYGACVRFFINGTQVGGNIAATNPAIATSMTPEFGLWVTGGSSASIDTAGLFVTYNRGALSLPTV